MFKKHYKNLKLENKVIFGKSDLFYIIYFIIRDMMKKLAILQDIKTISMYSFSHCMMNQ